MPLRNALFWLALAPLQAMACSCFGPQTFCATLDPPAPQFPEPEWWIPSDIILAVRISDYEYAADVKVVRSFSGNLDAEDVIRVWGDCGLLCRHYVTGGNQGDTVLWALQQCDLWGNGSCGTSFEEEGDYQLSICGVYWLDYADGIVSGSLTEEGWAESMDLDQFETLIDGCLSTSTADLALPSTEVLYQDGELCIAAPTNGSTSTEVCVTDLSGRVMFHTGFQGPRARIKLPASVSGVQLVSLYSVATRSTHRILIGP